MAEFGIVLFHSPAHAIRGEKVLTAAGFRIKMIPTPRQLSSDCGMALRFDPSIRSRVATVLEENRVPVSGIHEI
jgi:hypothetical protein